MSAVGSVVLSMRFSPALRYDAENTSMPLLLVLYSIQLALNYASETAKQVGLGESQCTICILMRDNVAYRLLYAVPRLNKALRGN